MKVQQMRHLIAASDSTSYAQAAKKCFTSRQNIVHSIRSIEAELNTTLFERKGNTLTLTPAGQQVDQRARQIVKDVDDLQVMFANNNTGQAPLSLAITSNLFAGIPESTSDYLARGADKLRFFEMDCEECYQEVCSGDVDAALVMSMERQFPRCSSVKICAERSYALMSDMCDLAYNRTVSAADLKDRKLVLMDLPESQYAPLLEQLDSLGSDRDSVNVISSSSSMRFIVRQYDAIGLVSERYAEHVPQGLRAVPISDKQLAWNFYMLYERNATNYRAVVKLVNDIMNSFRDDKNCGVSANGN